MTSKELTEGRAREAATAILEMAAAYHCAVGMYEWERAEQIAQTLARMAALSADGAQLMSRRHD